MTRKAPTGTPSKGDTATLRGRIEDRTCVVLKTNPKTNWATLQWSDGGGPRLAHLYELVRVE